MGVSPYPHRWPSHHERISGLAADAVREANTGQGSNDDRALCQALQALTEAVLLMVQAGTP